MKPIENSELRVVRSSSKGNCYALVTKTGTLLLEAGARLDAVRRIAPLSNVVGCVVTHKHSDHAAFIKKYAARFPLGAPYDTIKEYEIQRSALPLAENVTVRFGRFDVAPFRVPHSNADGSDCPAFGYLVRHPDFGSLLFATDTYMLPYKFPNVRHFLIEANYDDDTIEEAVRSRKISGKQRDRILLSHMSIDNTIKSILQCGTEKTLTITLCHLSSRHANPSEFRHRVQQRFGIPTYIATAEEVVTLV